MQRLMEIYTNIATSTAPHLIRATPEITMADKIFWSMGLYYKPARFFVIAGSLSYMIMATKPRYWFDEQYPNGRPFSLFGHEDGTWLPWWIFPALAGGIACAL